MDTDELNPGDVVQIVSNTSIYKGCFAIVIGEHHTVGNYQLHVPVTDGKVDFVVESGVKLKKIGCTYLDYVPARVAEWRVLEGK